MDQWVMVSSIRHKEKLNIVFNNRSYFGGNQSWFQNETKIFGGCGPICAFNLLKYYGLIEELNTRSRPLIPQLDEIYEFVKPTEIQKFIPNFINDLKLLPPTLGVRSLNHFKKRFLRLANYKFPNHQLKIREYRFNNTSKYNQKLLIEFIKEALTSNHPLCFINCFHESKLYLSSHLPKDDSSIDRVEDLNRLRSQRFISHWVLVTALYQSESSKEYYLECSTWGQVAYFKLSDFYLKFNWKNYLFKSGMLRIEL